MRRQTKQWAIAVVGIAIAAGGALYFKIWSTNQWARNSVHYARTLLTVGDAQGAYDLAQEVLQRRPEMSEACMLGAQASVQLRKLDDAIRFIDRYLEHATTGRDEALAFRGTILFEQRKLKAAEDSFAAAARENPKNVFALSQYCLMLLLQGRRAESLPLRFRLLRDYQNALDDPELRETLILLGNPQAIVAAQEILEAALVAEPDNVLPHLGLGRLALKQSRIEEARRHFLAVLEKIPDQAEAQARLGHAYLALPQSQRQEALLKWKKNLPESVYQHAEVWVVLGLWAQQVGEWDAAARCFWEAVRRDPNHQLACYQLAVSLSAAGDPSSAPPFQARAGRLQELALLCDQLHETGGTLMSRARNAQLCEELGRYWEAEAWTRLVLSYPVEPDSERSPEDRAAQLEEDQRAHALAESVRKRVADRISPDLPQVAKDHLLAEKVDLSDFPLPDFSEEGLAATRDLAVADLRRLPRFVEVTKEAGIDFQYFNGDDPTTEGRRMFEFTGGGVAVIDYDQDGWPDLYFTQGCDWPPDPKQTRYRDRLYRNLGNGRFLDVTEASGLGDRGFSQGAAVGDFDNDGWPDLLVANVGRNRLYHNNADGTFTEVAGAAGFHNDVWSTSAAIADLNLDSIPDIYQVNYLKGGRAFELICAREGKARSCSPTEFDAEQDQLFFGDGTGRFRDVTQSAGIVAPQGKGLGCVVADFHDSGRLEIF
ncbi:MAG TPA: tetratricopeptide repeat protein, partial [Planctomycetaceae bacterium]|nr:tetratricopeptide repeat protein [Planctomycetaceae bacterium]